MNWSLTRTLKRLTAIGLLATSGLTIAAATPAFASTKTLSDLTCSVGTLVEGGHFQIGVTYDCTQTASSTSGQAVTISAGSNGAGISAATWTASLASIGMTYAFVNNATTSPQIHWTGTPTAYVASGSTYNTSFGLSDGQPPATSFDNSFRTNFYNFNAQISATSGSTSVGTGSGSVTSGSSITLTPAIGTLPTGYSLTYIWKKNGTVIAGATSRTYTDSSVTTQSSYELDVLPAWTDGTHTASSSTEMWVGTFSLNIQSASTGNSGGSVTSPLLYNESNTTSSTLADSRSFNGTAGTVVFSDGSQLVISASGAIKPRLYSAFKGLASGNLKATYVANKKLVKFSCNFTSFGNKKASPTATKSVNGWFPKSYLTAKKACVLPKAAMTAAKTSSITVVVNLTFGRLWPTTAKAINPESKTAIKPAKRTMLLKFGKIA